jgi:hypothetical protein
MHDSLVWWQLLQTLIGEHVAGAMEKHVGMHVESYAGAISRLGDDPRHHIRADGRHVR